MEEIYERREARRACAAEALALPEAELIHLWARLWNQDQDAIRAGGRGLMDDPAFDTVNDEMRRRGLWDTFYAREVRGW